MRGLAQWWPARTQTPDWSSTWATSWGWTPPKANEITPERRTESGAGPNTRSSS